ncbi:hypothetical protein DFH94DRAFT_684595 [Russula ochroleuca]|uniref:Uncharacterized protein n=1 Tax=Russula ochroleuca TaxID=152965 RepID=A0A9P5JZM0_9AGAM|nr:hypothetical protein DFH94DRAFT_684595 [Russula ochroleuca]
MHFLRSFGLPFVLAFLAFLCFTSVFTVKASVRYTCIVAHRRTKICRLLASRLPPIPLRHPFAFWPPVFNSLPSIKGPDLAGSAGNIFPALRLGTWMTSMSPRGVARVDGVVMRVDILKKNFWEFLAVYYVSAVTQTAFESHRTVLQTGSDTRKREQVCTSTKSAKSDQLHKPGHFFEKDTGFYEKKRYEKRKKR